MVRGMTPPRTSRSSDGSAVELADAVQAWASQAREVLLEAATVYDRTITYAVLGAQVQERSGIETSVLLMNWIVPVLEQVAAAAAQAGDGPLTALCVRADGTVGEGYAAAVARHFGGVTPADPDAHAAEARLGCYRTHARDLPAHGGTARLTPQVRARRRLAAPEVQLPLCPVHRTTLPRTGRCDECS